MKLRSGRTIMATPPRSGGSDLNDMNASLWGELSRFIDLSSIYAKLPLGPFFRLRQVCREWNHLASDLRFLKQNFKAPISNLYFVVRQGTGHRLWMSRGSSWTSSPVPRGRCEVSGLLYEDSDRHGVFDLHTRVFHRLPALPPGMPMHANSMVGMTVDTTLIPYAFKVFVTSFYYGTSVYDSKSGAWTLQSSHHMYWGTTPFILLSIHHKELLYVFEETYFGIHSLVHTYNLENNVWGFKLFGGPYFIRWEYHSIGMWQDRWILFGMEPKSNLTVWVMNTYSDDEPWIMFDGMPNDLCEWVTRDLGHENVRNRFCGDHVLVYHSLEVEKRAILYNLDQKTWHKIELLETPT